MAHPDHLSDGIPGQLQLYPAQQQDLEAFLGRDPQQIFQPNRPIGYTQAFLLWGKGSGKDLVVSWVQCWITHILLCLRDPQGYLGLPPGEPIDNVVVAYNQHQSRTVYFAKFKQRLRNWPWLRRRIDQLAGAGAAESYLKEGGGKLGADSVLLPHQIRCWALPATPDSGEGKNILFWILDELAAFSSPTRLNQAERIHNMVVSSATSRFGNRWRGFAISYPRHRDDYMMRMYSRALAGELPDCYVSLRPTWEVNLKTRKEDFADHYRRNPEDAAMKYECRPPAAIDAFFRSPHLIVAHATGIPEAEVRRYRENLGWSDEEITAFAARGQNPLQAVDSAGDPVLDHRGFPQLAPWFRGKPRADYYVHLDPGQRGDAFGFALAHLETLPDGGVVPQVDLAFRWTGRQFDGLGEVFREAWFPDMVNQRERVTAAEVDFRTVREFIFYLITRLGFQIHLVSADTWNSAESLQALSARGIPVTNHVVTKADYDELKALIYSRQLLYYGWPILVRELEKLQLVNGNRVEAPRTAEGVGETLDSHKDVSDAVAALAWRLSRVRGSEVEFAVLPDPHVDPQAEAFQRFFEGDSRLLSWR